MKKYPCPVTNKPDVYPRCTTIISACTPKDWGPPWGANCACDFILESLKLPQKVPLESALPVIIETARKEYMSVSQKALDIGSKVHDHIEQYLRHQLEGNKSVYHSYSSAQVANAVKAFHKWREENDLKPIEVEKKVYGDRWAGTLDFYGYFNDKLYVIDWKSSKAHYPEMRYQVAAYRSAKNQEIAVEILSNKKYEGDISGELLRNRIEGYGVLRLDKETGLPDFKDHSKTYEADLKVFNAMVELYYLRHPRIRSAFEKNKEATE